MLQGLPVLVVDDNETNRRILVKSLSLWGMRPVEAESAAAAIRVMAERSTSFPLVVTDVNMPEMDGFELAAHIKGRDAAALIVMLTSNNRAGDLARCRELGIQTYLTKPITRDELHGAIVRILAPVPQVAPGKPQVDRRRSQDQTVSLRILLAEDNPVNQKVAARMLQQLGHVVVVAGDGLEALNAFKREHFDLVLMDIQMPQLDGLAATAAIRNVELDLGTRERIPILAVTAHAMAGDQERCLAAGMDGYLAKPLHKQDLLEALKPMRPRRPHATRDESFSALPALQSPASSELQL